MQRLATLRNRLQDPRIAVDLDAANRADFGRHLGGASFNSMMCCWSCSAGH